MKYNLPWELYNDWMELTYSKELLKNIVEELKEQMVQGE